MKVVVIGATPLARATTEILLRRRHDVIIVERDRAKIGDLEEELDCGFIHGDGSKPAILREAGPQQDDVLLCLTDDDQDNLLAALVGRSLGFGRVIPKIADAEYEPISAELGLNDTIIPDQATARTLSDVIEGQHLLDLSTLIRGDVRFVSFFVDDTTAGPVRDLELPSRTRPICVYRDNDFCIPDDGFGLRRGDEVILITHAKHVATLRDRWLNSGDHR